MSKLSKRDQAEANASAFFAVTDRTDAPLFEHKAQPLKSLPNIGFVWLIGISAVGFTLPLMILLGTQALWMLLPHVLLAITLLWYAIRRNDHDRSIYDHIRIWPDLIAVHHHNPRGVDQYWYTNPYWVRLKLQDTPTVTSYLTVTGGEREIELASFLSPEERIALKYQIDDALKRLQA